MGESTCLMQPFSYASGLPNEANEGNPIHALGESVSFGRFLSESLSWEKWSTFSSNRYVEEAERYSRPGSVAQKKAFFEAHYKNLAARKAAALLEQANAANLQTQAEEDAENLSTQVSVHEQEATAPTTETKPTYDADMVGTTEVGGTDGLKDESLGKIEDVDHSVETEELELKETAQLENSEKKVESSTSQSEAADTRKVLEELEVSETNLMENLNTQVSVHEQEATDPTTETKPTHDADMVGTTEVGGTDGLKDESLGKIEDVDHSVGTEELELKETTQLENSEKKIESSTSQSEAADTRKVLEELEVSEKNLMEKPLLKNLISIEAGFEVKREKRQAALSSRQLGCTRASKLLPSPSRAEPLASIRSKKEKENNSTPSTKKPAMKAAERKRSSPKASHRSISFTPAEEFDKLTAAIMRKMDSSRASSNSTAAKDCSTPLRTPTMGEASSNGRPKHPSATPWSETKSVREPLDSSASVSKSVGGKWSFLNANANRNKSQSPSIFASFTLRTEERAARRKQKLEEKFNCSQTKKATAGTELKKLSPSFCFKARPLPHFYKDRSAKNHKEEVSLKHQKSATSGTNPNPSKESSIPRQRPWNKNLGSKQFPEKRNQFSAQSLIARVKMAAAHQNTSPNIQHA